MLLKSGQLVVVGDSVYQVSSLPPLRGVGGGSVHKKGEIKNTKPIAKISYLVESP